MLEELLLKKRKLEFEGWQAALVAIFGGLGVVAFGALVDNGATNYSQAGLLSKSALKIARLPAEGRSVLATIIDDDHPQRVLEQRFDGEVGFKFVDTSETDGALLLLTRFNNDQRRSIVDLVDLETGTVLHSYRPDIRALRKGAELAEQEVAHRDPELNFAVDFRPNEYILGTPFMNEDGSLIVKDFDSPMFKIDACSNVEWTQYGAFHHSVERGSNGNYWTVMRSAPPSLDNVAPGFEEDTIVSVSPDGEVVYKKVLSELLIENGLQHLVYPYHPFNDDPFHLNDVEPVLTDGPHWKKGDLFLSVRNLSTIMLYRPSTNKVLWLKHGPWMAQHDVDILNDHQISVFNNNARTSDKSGADPYELQVIGTNEILVYDFATDEVTSPYKTGFEQLDVRTPIQGLSEILPNGDLFVEEQAHGRLAVFDEDGDLKWSFVNRAENGLVYQVHWSRYIQGEQARALRERVAAGFGCES